jgi:hypothetical protein
MASAPRHPEPEEFSLVLGGPVYQILRRLLLSGPGLELLGRRMVFIPLVAWVPLVALTLYEGRAFGRGVAVPFLYDLETHARFLIAIPLFLYAERYAHERLQRVVRQFVDAGIITSETLPGFRDAIARALRLRNSVVVEVALLVLVFGLGWLIWQGGSAITLSSSTWYMITDGVQQHRTIAGVWYAHVSLPVFQFLLLRWYFRLFVWFLFLWRVSLLPLSLTATHPDRAGGLGFLSGGALAFGPVILGESAFLSALIGTRILFHGKTLVSFQYEIAAFLVLQLLLVLGPLCVFAPDLLALKRQGRREYGALAGRYTREFHAKWIEGRAPADEPLVGSADIQSLADLGNSYDVVREMRAVPFGRDTIIQVAVCALGPLVPLVLSIVPAEEILQRLFGMLL